MKTWVLPWQYWLEGCSTKPSGHLSDNDAKTRYKATPLPLIVSLTSNEKTASIGNANATLTLLSSFKVLTHEGRCSRDNVTTSTHTGKWGSCLCTRCPCCISLRVSAFKAYCHPAYIKRQGDEKELVRVTPCRMTYGLSTHIFETYDNFLHITYFHTQCSVSCLQWNYFTLLKATYWIRCHSFTVVKRKSEVNT